mmetsp:Transcript_53736/g.69013  ORF Transcript_53736/g.69013 Transcript_53736/m.69013 type:complete len:301 (+) Transcript_53736:39-941(+)
MLLIFFLLFSSVFGIYQIPSSRTKMNSWIHRNFAKPSQIERTSLILLNTPLQPELVSQIWKFTSLHICADGASNRLKNILPTHIPDLIVGDLDSAKKETLQYYQQYENILKNNNKKCEILNLSNDQDSTDLEKALKQSALRGCDNAIIIGQFINQGRLDHLFGMIQSLFKCLQSNKQKSNQNIHSFPFLKNAIVLSEESMMQLILPQVNNQINTNSKSQSKPQIKEHQLNTIYGHHCGLIPLDGICSNVNTKGLKWDLKNDELKFGSLVSTSNIIMSDSITISTDEPLIFTMTLLPPSSE